MAENPRFAELDNLLRGAIPKVDARLLARFEAAVTTLRAIRKTAARTASYERRLELAHEAWQSAGPLYDDLEPHAGEDEGVRLLLYGLDAALMQAIDNPDAGPGLLGRQRQDVRRDHAHEDRAADPCCLTSIRFRNLRSGAVRVTAGGALGSTAMHVFPAGKDSTLARRELPPETEGGHGAAGDNDAPRPRATAIPGGLGRCVTIKAEIQNASGDWFEIMSREVCCDEVRNGDILDTTPPPAPAGATTERPSPVLEILSISSQHPCPDGATEVSADGSYGHEFRECPGLAVPGKGHFVGSHVFLLYVPPESCRRFCFIQAVKRTVTVNGVAVRGVTNDWRLDLLRDQPRRPGCYAYQKDRPEGGRVMNDSPGLVNPWGAIKLEDGSIFRPRPGQRLVATWEFRTYAVCLDPARVYGQFAWSLKVDLTVPAGPPPQGGSVPGVDIELTGPVFTPRDQMTPGDVDLFGRVMS